MQFRKRGLAGKKIIGTPASSSLRLVDAIQEERPGRKEQDNLIIEQEPIAGVHFHQHPTLIERGKFSLQ